MGDLGNNGDSRHIAGGTSYYQVLPVMSFHLTARERSLLNMLCIGQTIKEMADYFEVSETCIRNCFDRIRIKFRVKSRVELAVRAVREGIV